MTMGRSWMGEESESVNQQKNSSVNLFKVNISISSYQSISVFISKSKEKFSKPLSQEQQKLDPEVGKVLESYRNLALPKY